MLWTGFSLGCLAIVFLIVWRDFGKLLVGKAFLALLVTVAAFLLKSIPPPEYRWITGDVMTMMPAAFWLLCQLAFSHRPKLNSVWAWLALYSFIAPAFTRPFGAHDLESGLIVWLGFRLPQFAEYAVLLNGLWVTAAHWNDDLLEMRRRMRLALLASVGITGLCVTIALNTGHGAAGIVPFMVSLSLMLTAAVLLRGAPGVLLGAQARIKPEEARPQITDEQQKKDEVKAMVAKLEYVMEDEKFYRTEKLTLKMLAKRINLPEYKTRTLINETFNYRNFNDYVNQLRIEEACDRLDIEPDTPIQNIALDVGYRSLSSFNRAFKEIMAKTPTEYRRYTLSKNSPRTE